MRILTDDQRRALSFVQAANDGGFQPKSEDVEAWLAEPTSTSDMLGGWVWRHMRTTLGSNSTTEHALSLGWLASGSRGQHLTISPLGRALLRSHDSEPDTTDAVLVADNRDPLAYPRLIGALTDVGPGLLVDPYLDAQELLDIVEHTQLERVVVGQKDKAKTTRLKMTLRNPEIAAKVEVRASSEVHDRMVISATGAVWLIGASLNTVSRRSSFTTLTPMPGPAAEVLRDRVEECWSSASALSPSDDRQAEESSGG